MRRFGALLAALLLAGCLTACGGEEMQTAQVFAMDTVMVLKAGGGDAASALRDAEDELYRLDRELSRTRESSAVSRLNSAPEGTAEVGEELRDLIARALDFSGATGGAFDITLAPVSSAWGFTEDAYRVPAREELEELMAHVGAEHVHLGDGTAVSLDPGTQIDLGAIAKGYASDVVAAICRENGVAHSTVSLGGNVWVCGGNPEGKPWQIGIQDPARPEEADAYVGILRMSDGFAVTSGGYQRYFEEDGKLYHHIIDPATGYPAESGLTSVTVVSEGTEGSGTMCDALSTALFVMGEERALDFWRSGAFDFEAILVTEDGRLLVTAGLEDSFTPDETAGYAYEVVS